MMSNPADNGQSEKKLFAGEDIHELETGKLYKYFISDPWRGFVYR